VRAAVKAASLAIWLASLAAMPEVALAQDTRAGAEVFAECAICHEVGTTAKSGVGPILNGVIGRNAGSAPGYSYSTASKDSGITWDEPTLKAYLKNPRAKLPGTKMVFRGLADDQEIADVIAYLKQFGPDGKPAAAAQISTPPPTSAPALATEQAPVPPQEAAASPPPKPAPPEPVLAEPPAPPREAAASPPPKPAPPEPALAVPALAERAPLPVPPPPAPAASTGVQHFRAGVDSLRAGHADVADREFDQAGRYFCDYFDLAAKLLDPSAPGIKRDYPADGLKALQYYLKARADPSCGDEADRRIRDLLDWARSEHSQTVLRWWNEHR
jgi:cytochrome c